MRIVDQITTAIERDPSIKLVIVTSEELALVRSEIEDSMLVKDSPRPNYGPPFGDIDRLLWDNLQAMKAFSLVQIMGRPVIAREYVKDFTVTDGPRLDL